MTKAAPAQFPINELIAKRWSPRSFSEKTVSDESINSIFEAARWAASAGNEQPWEYFFAKNGTSGFDKLWGCLLAGNQSWNKNSNVLIVAVARTTFTANKDKQNYYALHDLGMANAQIFLQATSMDIYCHPMAGIDKAKLKETLELGENQEPICMIALGYIESAEKLEEPFKTREIAPRIRKSITEFTKRI